MKELQWLVFVIIILWIVWFFTGGPQSERAQGGPFLKPPAPLDTGETYGELPSLKKPSGNTSGEDASQRESSGTSFFKDEIRIGTATGARESDPQAEYVEIKASPENKNLVYIGDWVLKNSSGKSAAINKATKLPYTGTVNVETPLFLAPGEKAFITSGRSPIGVSFQVNKCSGYLEQFQYFSPPLPADCPSPATDIYINKQDLEQVCGSYVSTLPRCEIYTDELPSGFSAECVSYIRNNINYNSCVELHKNDFDFFKPEWRIYLGRNVELWENANDLIRLYDHAGSLVDSKSY